MTVAAAIGWFALCLLSSSAVVACLSLWEEGAVPIDLLTLGFASAGVYVAATFGALRVHAPRSAFSEALALGPVSPVALGCCFLAGLGLKLPAESVVAWVCESFPLDPEVLAARERLLMAESPGQLMALILIACVVGPIAEELFFRGALFGQLAKGSRLRAVWWTAGLFVAAHAEVRHWPALAGLALVLSYVRLRSDRLAPGLALHIGFNAASVAAIRLFSGTQSEDIPAMAWVGGFLVSLIAIVGFHWASGQPRGSKGSFG